ncbi:Metalloenzyme, LuxS/M16 peptidase-like protein [Cristinia sonorae]|uniref:Presequence protease, mitochondrial n=1 Tax=Cristinia sonorae TaxID=1940300 RepID=A0A8K0XS00_9AGAR|nr:Metalloenzyme, LuxS/M16 peptidase-like protein [Cristinia sonorae]
MDKYGNFDLITSFKLDFAEIHVSKWRSRVSGLTVVHLDYDAPIVNGYFVVGTEIFNDTGCPHTLEHLVFMGSEKYPYKGIIDHLANRGFSNGTNAWTATDHTAYTVSTAGEQGFLQLLPIYVDHVLYPTLTKAGYVTEVHHVNGSGEDSGVVYSEMQGRQNTSGDLMALRMQRLANPEGSAYRSETGGLMEALRKLSVEQIRDYHHAYYVPQNLSLIVSGKLASGTLSLLEVVQNKVEPTIAEHGQNKGPHPEGWKRPFVETASANRSPPTVTITDSIEFPEKDESVGELQINFMGPPPNAFLERKGLDIIGTYLTSSPVAPLNKEFIEIEEPLCTYIYFGEDIAATRVDLPIYVGSVPTEHLDGFHERLQECFGRIVDDGIDVKRMAMVIDRDERQLRSKVESSKGDTFSTTVIGEFLYGAEDGSELAPALDEISLYGELRKWSNEQWIALFKKYYVDPPCIVLHGKPSAAMAERLETEEKARIAKQKGDLGPTGLKRLEIELEEAKKEHDQEIPTKVLTDFPVPNVKSIAWIPVQSLQQPGKGPGRTSLQQSGNIELAKHIEADGSSLPFFVQYDHVQSDFVSVHAYFSLAKLPNRLRPHISTYLSVLFSLPVTRSNGERLTHEEVVNQLDNDTVSYEVSLGVNGAFTEALRITIKVEVNNYESAIAWLKDLVYGSEFAKDRLQVNVAKIQQSLPELKRDGSTVLSSISSNLLSSEESTSRAGGILPQAEFIPKLAAQLQESPEEAIKDFEEIRRYLTDPSGVRFSVTGNILDLKQPRSIWDKYFAQSLPETTLEPVRFAHEVLSDVGKKPAQKAVVVALPTIESSFVNHWSKGIQGFSHPDYPALRVAAEILNATESYLWRYIRGSGLAYGAYVSVDLESALLSFTLYRSSNCMEAFKQAKTVIEGLVSGKISLEDTTLDAAKSGIVFGVTKGVSTPGRAALLSFANQAFKGVSQNYNLELLEKFQAVTKQDVIKSFETYFLPLFDSTSSVAVVVTSPAKTQEIAEGLTQSGFMVEQRTLEVEPDEDGTESGSEDGSDSESDESS